MRAITLVIWLILFSIVAVAEPVDDFVQALQQDPSSYTLVFENSASLEMQRAMKQFIDSFGIKQTDIASNSHIGSSSLVVIGNPKKNIIMKSLGVTSGVSVRDGKLIIASEDPVELQKLINSVISKKASTKPPVQPKPAAKPSVQPKPVAQPSSVVGKAFSINSVLGNPVFIAVLSLLILLPVAGIVTAKQIKKHKAASGSADTYRNQIEVYLSSYIHQGYTKSQLQQDIVPKLVQQGWDQNMVNEVLGRL